MSFSLRYDKVFDCIIVSFKNSIKVLIIQEVTRQVVHLCKETGCRRILNDMTAASIDMSMMHLFDYIDNIEKANAPDTVKSALVFPANFYDSRILESTARNRGNNLKVFFDIKEAREWLMGDT
jgi:hypothetical protein